MKPTKEDREAAVALDEHNETLARAIQEKFKLPLVIWPGIRDMIDAHMIPERGRARLERNLERDVRGLMIARLKLWHFASAHKSVRGVCPGVITCDDARILAAAEALDKENT